MTSKEKFKAFLDLISDCGIDKEDKPTFYKLWDEIENDLERLEVLESNSDKVVKDSVKLINKNLELQKENEKLKKVLDILKKYYKIIVKDCDFPIYETPQYTLGIRFHSWNEKPEGLFAYITKEDFELLKGVLGE